MTANIGLIWARGRSSGAYLLLGQRQLGPAVSSSNSSSNQRTAISHHRRTTSRHHSTNVDTRLRLLASLSSPSERLADGRDIGSKASFVGTAAIGHRRAACSLLLRNNPLRRPAAFLTSARPSQQDEGAEAEGEDEEMGIEGEQGAGLSLEESRYDPALGRYPWEEKQDRLAELDDGDQVCTAVDNKY